MHRILVGLASFTTAVIVGVFSFWPAYELSEHIASCPPQPAMCDLSPILSLGVAFGTAHLVGIGSGWAAYKLLSPGSRPARAGQAP